MNTTRINIIIMYPVSKILNTLKDKINCKTHPATEKKIIKGDKV